MKKGGSVILVDPPDSCVETRETTLDHGLALAMVPEHYISHLHSRVCCLLSAYADTTGVTPHIEKTLNRSSDRWLAGSALPHDLPQADALAADSRQHGIARQTADVMRRVVFLGLYCRLQVGEGLEHHLVALVQEQLEFLLCELRVAGPQES